MAAPSEWAGGELVIAGGTDWALLGKSGGKGKKTDKEMKDELDRLQKYPNLASPHRIKQLMGVKVMFVAAGCTATHVIIGDADGRCLVWGRNDKGQLGLGDQLNRYSPTVVPALQGKQVIGAAAGKHHTLVVTQGGESYAFGSNVQGQLGKGSIKAKGKEEDLQLVPVKCAVEQCSAVAAGQEFSMWLCGGQLWAAGLPQYGCLGDGSDHEYNAKDSSIKLMYDPQPTPLLVKALAGKTITSVACGQHHTLATDSDGACYSWGNGGYGRLGHKVQQDEHTPKAIATFSGRLTIPGSAVMAAGSTSSFCTSVGGQLFGWGKLKSSGDNTMYPQPMYDLQGWNLRSMACGPGHFAVAADKSVITWGAATNGELGYGPHGKKSSANPAKCDDLDNVHTQQVACGVGFTAFLVAADDPKVAALPVFEAPEVAEASEAAAGSSKEGAAKGKAAGAKRKAPAAAAGRGKKAK